MIEQDPDEQRRILGNAIHYLSCVEITGIEAQEVAEAIQFLSNWLKLSGGKLRKRMYKKRQSKQEVKQDGSSNE